jgi:hypothetical protein
MSTIIKMVVITYLCLLPAMASADGFRWPFYKDRFSYFNHTPTSNSVPELDANSSSAALCLLLGCAMVLSGRRRRIQ